MWRSARLIHLLSVLFLTCPAGAQVMVGYPDSESQSLPSKYSNNISDNYTLPVLETIKKSRPMVRVVENGATQAVTYRTYTLETQNKADKPQQPVSFSASSVSYDEEKRIVQAKGDVFIRQDGRVLNADNVIYNVRSGEANASGSVILTDLNGDVHKADEVMLHENLKRGRLTNLRSVLADGSTIKAKTGYRTVDNKTVMNDAVYTACKTCDVDSGKSPIWQIKASEVVHNNNDKSVEYKNATFEAYGLPIAYFPYFSHPDGSEKRKNGLLAPNAGFKSNEGFMLDNRYYWSMAPDEDMTFGLRAFAKENPLLYAQWRKRWSNAVAELNFGGTSSEYSHTVGGIDVKEDAEPRGHVMATALWDVDNKWRLGADINWASDDEYMDQYDFTGDDVLTSDVYAERFDGRDFGTVRFLTFQDTRTLEDAVDQPELFPEVYASFQGNPNAVPLIGGSWYLNTSYLGLRRNGEDEQEVDRLSLGAGWKKRHISSVGIVSDIDISAYQDAYFVKDFVDTTGLRHDRKNETRFFPQIHAVSSLPMVRDFSNYKTSLEPIVALTFAPDLDDDLAIPNEDSQDVQLDIDALFNANRFPGVDGIEDQSRITYGLRSGLHFFDDGQVNAFLGQSYRFDQNNNPFSAGSGLENRSSDVVGSLGGQYGHHNFDYRFQLDSRHLNSGRYEFDLNLDWKRYGVDAQYLFAKSIDGTEFDANREQASASGFYYIADNWRTNAGLVRDFGESAGLRKAFVGIDHYDQCMSWGLTAQRNLTDSISNDSDLEILFRLGLKNIGEFNESQWGGVSAPNC